MILKEPKRDSLLFDRLVERRLFAFWVLGLLGVNLHEDAALPSRSKLGLAVHKV